VEPHPEESRGLRNQCGPAEEPRRFIQKHGLPFPLISDEAKEIVQAYGVWVEKSMYGKKYMGTERSTVIIGPEWQSEGRASQSAGPQSISISCCTRWAKPPPLMKLKRKP